MNIKRSIIRGLIGTIALLTRIDEDKKAEFMAAVRAASTQKQKLQVLKEYGLETFKE